MDMIDVIKKLRNVTGLGLCECKKAYDIAKGNFDDALKHLKEFSNDRWGRLVDYKETNCGIVVSYIHFDRVGALVELWCETDFVAKMPEFKTLATIIARQVVGTDPPNTDELLSQPNIQDVSVRIKDMVGELSAKCGENITIGKFTRFDIGTKFKSL